jgi:hypothetical protein
MGWFGLVRTSPKTTPRAEKEETDELARASRVLWFDHPMLSRE